ncbi:MAG: DUF167 domain-containing protein [Verrucomicrobia bacterium]|nr:DUF167 domain-containing protein [Verrucomicrobiota bacterium]
MFANSRRSKIYRDHSDSLKVYVHSPREKGKANKELLDLFESTFKPVKLDIKISQGELQPKKIIDISFFSVEDYHLFLKKLSST